MHVAVDLNWFLQSIVTALFLAFGFLYLVRNTASRYFVVDSSFDSSATNYSLGRKKGQNMAAAGRGPDACAVCGLLTTKQCSSCKMVKYCSEACQRSHWNSEHKTKCMDLKSFCRDNVTKSTSAMKGRKTSLVPLDGSSNIFKQSNKILFPYEEFVELFKWDKSINPPCGLLNCGNSCFANVVLQCLSHTRPLVAYLLEKGHRIECLRNDWCFLCEFQTHLERASQSLHPFSPINILSRLPNIGGNLGYGKQEDAHEFMRFAIDTMQSVCLDEFGGEKAVHPCYQETTLIQHIFGGHLQSQVICTKCNNVSNQIENMMDLTVEIHGDAGSLEECLDQFTAKERLHGDNMYKCDGCNDYVMAWKRLTVHRAPNILTIALKRFQSGRFGKLNKRVTFPETLDLSPYVSELKDGNDVYKLYAVIVHVDMLNASFFGHYICYIKDFCGNWYRVDDCKVARVDLHEVLSQGAYMLLYSRISARPSCLLPAESVRKDKKEDVIVQVEPSLKQHSECLDNPECFASPVDCGQSSSSHHSELGVNYCGEASSSITEPDIARGTTMKQSSEASLHIFKDVELHDSNNLCTAPSEVASPVKHTNQLTLANASLIDKNFTRLDIEHEIEPTCPISHVEDESCYSNDNLNEVLLKISTKESSAGENFTFEKHENAHDVSSMAFTAGEVFDEVNSAKPLCSNSSPSPDGIKDETKTSDGQSSAAKLKPIFTPGFLGKRPRNKSKRENKVSGESSELTSKSHPTTQTNSFAKPLPLCLDGCFLKDGEKPCSVYENENMSLESDVFKIIENGHSCDQIASGVGIKSN